MIRMAVLLTQIASLVFDACGNYKFNVGIGSTERQKGFEIKAVGLGTAAEDCFHAFQRQRIDDLL